MRRTKMAAGCLGLKANKMNKLLRFAAVNLLFSVAVVWGQPAPLTVSPGSRPYGALPPLTISPSSLPYGALGKNYNAQLTANGSGSYQWSVSQGSLPPGLNLDSFKGTITGVPNTGGTYSFTVTVLDTQTQQMASAKYTVGILN